MASNPTNPIAKSVEIKYCLRHGKEVPVTLKPEVGPSLPYSRHYEVDILDFDNLCFGPFAECPPPPVTEEEWDFIFSNENANNIDNNEEDFAA